MHRRAAGDIQHIVPRNRHRVSVGSLLPSIAYSGDEPGPITMPDAGMAGRSACRRRAVDQSAHDAHHLAVTQIDHRSTAEAVINDRRRDPDHPPRIGKLRRRRRELVILQDGPGLRGDQGTTIRWVAQDEQTAARRGRAPDRQGRRRRDVGGAEQRDVRRGIDRDHLGYGRLNQLRDDAGLLATGHHVRRSEQAAVRRHEEARAGDPGAGLMGGSSVGRRARVNDIGQGVGLGGWRRRDTRHLDRLIDR